MNSIPDTTNPRTAAARLGHVLATFLEAMCFPVYQITMPSQRVEPLVPNTIKSDPTAAIQTLALAVVYLADLCPGPKEVTP